MPRATADLTKTVRKDLKSCPGGFVLLRKLNNGERLHRKDIASNVQASGENEDEMSASIGINMSGVSQYEFQHSIVEHNLEDENGKTLNFHNKRDFDNLDGNIADEIDDYINKLNRGEDLDPSEGSSTEPSSGKSQSTPTKPAELASTS